MKRLIFHLFWILMLINKTSSAEGMFSTTAPTDVCGKLSAKCSPLHIPQEAESATCSDGFNIGSTCEVTCNRRYVYSGVRGNNIFSCRIERNSGCPIASWNVKREVYCMPLFCPDLEKIKNGLLNCDRHFKRGSICKYSCDEGYELIPADHEGRLCWKNGIWIGRPPPECNEIDECTRNIHTCDKNAICTNSPNGSFTCTCKSGFTGCGQDGNCMNLTECTANATCANIICKCISGYTGPGPDGNCRDVDECTTNTHTCDANAICANSPVGSFTCASNSGYTGSGLRRSFTKIDTNGLQVNDLIEWKGVISTRRAPAQLYIFAPFSLTRSFTVMKMEIQGARNKLAFSAGLLRKEIVGHPGREVPCTLGKSLIAPDMRFRVIIRVHRREMMVYWNGKLKFTHPLISSRQRLEAITNIRIYGSATTEVFRKLTDEDLAKELPDSNCGEITVRKEIPDYCPSTRTGCRIVGGGPARPGQQPWQAAIRRKTVTGEQEAHVCGATLINECWALTAGHCFPSTSKRALDGLVLRVGNYYNRDNSSHSENATIENSEDLEIEKVIKHERYQSYPTARNDIALIKLKKCAAYNDFVKPACLPTSSSKHIDGTATRCGISGWGATNATQQTNEFPACLQTAAVRVKSVSSCKSAYPDNFDQNTMLCAAGPGCADTCQGNGGGPLICAIGRTNPNFTLWGVTSWGISCGEARTPGVYTRLTSYIRWLYINMKLSPDDQSLISMIRSGSISRYNCQHRKSP